MEPIRLLLAALSGGVVALLLTVFGGGGSVLAVPLLLSVVGLPDRAGPDVGYKAISGA